MQPPAPIPDPILLDVPTQIETPRLVLRAPRAGDGPAVNEAVLETIDALQRWMPWAVPAPTAEQSELWCRTASANFILRKTLPMLMFLRASPDVLVGSTGFNEHLDWSVPSFEIGYWVRRRFEGQGYATEAARAVCALAFDTLRAARIEIRCDDTNERSWRVAERLGFAFEATRRDDSRTPDGVLRSTRVYSLTRPTAC